MQPIQMDISDDDGGVIYEHSGTYLRHDDALHVMLCRDMHFDDLEQRQYCLLDFPITCCYWRL